MKGVGGGMAESQGSSFTGTLVIWALQMSQGVLQTGNRMFVGAPQEIMNFEAGK